MLPLLLAAGAPAAAQATSAQPVHASASLVPAGKISAANPASIVSYLQNQGYRAKLVTDDGDRPYIESATEGATFQIYLENCTDNRDCQDVMFRSSYERRAKDPVTIETINAFNRDARWARAYLDDELSPVVEYDVMFTDGLLDEKSFEHALDLWTGSLSDFHKSIDW